MNVYHTRPCVQFRGWPNIDRSIVMILQLKDRANASKIRKQLLSQNTTTTNSNSNLKVGGYHRCKREGKHDVKAVKCGDTIQCFIQFFIPTREQTKRTWPSAPSASPHHRKAAQCASLPVLYGSLCVPSHTECPRTAHSILSTQPE